MKIALSIVVAMFLISCSEEKASTTTNTHKKEPLQTVVKTEVKSIAQEKKVEVVVPKELTGADIFKKCISCHGIDAGKKALNKSQVIKGWSSKKVLTALQGYKAGTYGSTMKGLMKTQVSKLSDAQLELVAKHISEL